jgi:hypothetical protein
MPATGQANVRDAVGTSGMLLAVHTWSVANLRYRSTVFWTLSLLQGARSLNVVTRLLLIFLCLGLLSTVTGCSVAPTSYGTSSSGSRTDDETRQDRKQWGRHDEMYHPWNRPVGYNSEGA